MSLVTPIGVAVPAFDATHDQLFTFTVQGGDQVVANRLTVIDNVSGDIVYQKTVESYVYSQTLPAYSLRHTPNMPPLTVIAVTYNVVSYTCVISIIQPLIRIITNMSNEPKERSLENSILGLDITVPRDTYRNMPV